MLHGDDDRVSNLMQLLKWSARDDPAPAEWLKKTNKYVSHSVQNELLQVMALTVLWEISHSIHESTFYSIMCNACMDASNKEQLVICIRWIGKDLEVHVNVIGLYAVADISAQTIFKVVQDALVQVNLELNKCLGQCYDGSSTTSVPRSGVAKQLHYEEPRALCLHCHSHALKLAA